MRNELLRRKFLHMAATASGSMIAGFDPQARSWVLDEQTGSKPLAELPKLDGTLLYDAASCSAKASDAGHIVHRMPVAVLKPGSVRDVVRIVQYANQHSLKVAMRGQGHSSYGQSLVEAGVVIDSSPLNRIDLNADSLDAQAGARWGDVAKTSLAKGLTPPVMLNDASQTVTVGGTLSIGGMGTTAHHFGAQIDNIEELDVVTGNGRAVTCSRSRDRELFDMVLAGLGQSALILRARIRLVPAQSHVLLHDFFYQDFETFFSDLKRLAVEGRFDHLAGPIRNRGGIWSFTIGAGKFYTPPNHPDPSTLKAGLRFSSASEPARIPYWDFLHRLEDTTTEEAGGTDAQGSIESYSEIGMFVPESGAKEFIRQILARRSDLVLAALFEVCPLNTNRFTRPLFRMPNEDFALVVWIVDATHNSTEISAMLASHRSLYERMRAAHGKRYAGFGAVPFSQADWIEHFGPEVWQRLSEAKRKFDPKHVLTPGPGIFGQPKG
jgi:FAD/FMN-containing dehydrogenase